MSKPNQKIATIWTANHRGSRLRVWSREDEAGEVRWVANVEPDIGSPTWTSDGVLDEEEAQELAIDLADALAQRRGG